MVISPNREISINEVSQKDENVAVILSFIGSLSGVATMVCSGGGLLLTSTAVSYTHLDVYKRQEEHDKDIDRLSPGVEHQVDQQQQQVPPFQRRNIVQK